MPLPDNKKRYTYADYCTWDDDERWELIEGVPHAMSLAPSRRHQEISREMFLQLGNYLKGKPCELFSAPFDVRLNADGEDDTVCQPDLLVVCDHSKLDNKGCKGAPDLIVEILSPSSIHHDQFVKMRLYQKAGVREYWIVNPETNMIHAHTLQNGQYFVRVYADGEIAEVDVLKGCEVSLKDVFGE